MALAASGSSGKGVTALGHLGRCERPAVPLLHSCGGDGRQEIGRPAAQQ